MLLIISFCLLITFIQANPIVDQSCEVHASEPSDCYTNVWVPNTCHSATLDLTKSEFTKSCNNVTLFWSYPVDNLTITFGNGHNTPFTMAIPTEYLLAALPHIYRIIDGRETEVTTTKPELIQTSDSNNHIILKFQGPPALYFYGVFINYYFVKRHNF